MLRKINPFVVTKAVDLSDEEIDQLWVSLGSDDGDSIFQPTAPVPLFLLGGKGSGKTHLMRYYSYPLQRLRHRRAGLSPLEGISRDSFLGIYILLGGLNAERFNGRRQSDEVWRAIFEYYFELWVAQELLHICVNIADTGDLRSYEPAICADIVNLFDEPPGDGVGSFVGLLTWCSSVQKELDRAINNIIFEGRFRIPIRATRGRLIFGIPRILAAHVPALRRVVFSYQLDEFENISESQQRYVQTLVRERQSPATFRIGGRLYGVKTYETLAAGEENREGSEFTRVILDQRFRQDPKEWEEFAFDLVRKRLENSNSLDARSLSDKDIEQLFEVPDLSWNSAYVFWAIGSPAVCTGPHFDHLREKLQRGLVTRKTPGLTNESEIVDVLRNMAVPGSPVLEKVNMLLLYQAWFRKHDLRRSAREIQDSSRSFVQSANARSSYRTAVQHYGSDMVAQLLRSAGKRALPYFGMRTFVRMSEGLPRTLMVLLKHVFAWAIYRARSDRIEIISADDQELGVRDAAEWFIDTMRKPGEDGAAIRTGIERIGRLFESNRYADKPVECSLLGFSVRERDLQPETIRRLLAAEHRSFLIRVPQGEIDRNTRERLAKFQLNAALSPNWGLPVARRGIARFQPSDVDLIFDPGRREEFERFHRDWVDRMTAPDFGDRNGARAAPPADLFGEYV